MAPDGVRFLKYLKTEVRAGMPSRLMVLTMYSVPKMRSCRRKRVSASPNMLLSARLSCSKAAFSSSRPWTRCTPTEAAPWSCLRTTSSVPVSSRKARQSSQLLTSVPRMYLRPAFLRLWCMTLFCVMLAMLEYGVPGMPRSSARRVPMTTPSSPPGMTSSGSRSFTMRRVTS